MFKRLCLLVLVSVALPLAAQLVTAPPQDRLKLAIHLSKRGMFDDVGEATPDGVRLRQKTYEGVSWFYVVNTEAKPVRVTLEVPKRTRDLVRDERVGGLMGASTLDLVLQPYELRSYSAPEGLPRRVKK